MFGMQGFELLLAHENNVPHLLKPLFLPLSLLLCGRQGHLQDMQGGWQADAGTKQVIFVAICRARK